MNNRIFVSRLLMAIRTILLGAILALFTAQDAQAQSTSVSYQGGLITIRCSEATLEQVFEQIKSETGLELFLEDPIKSKRLTADIEAQPVNQALERLLAGAGVNYAMMFDRENWQRVDKIFIGEGGDAVASSQSAPNPSNRRNNRRARRRQALEPEDEFMEDPDEGLDDPDDFDDFDDTGDEDAEGDFQEEVPAPAANPGYLPPPPAFPRSSFTPGLESSPFGAQTGGNQQQEQPQSGTSPPTRPAPPAYYPFTDQFGRPIPVPNDPNAQQQEEDEPQ